MQVTSILASLIWRHRGVVDTPGSVFHQKQFYLVLKALVYLFFIFFSYFHRTYCSQSLEFVLAVESYDRSVINYCSQYHAHD